MGTRTRGAPPQRRAGPAKRRAGLGPRWLRHGSLVATEAVLIAALVKDWVNAAVLRSGGMPGWGKVLFVMGATVGILGGLYFGIERLLARGVARTHSAFGVLPLPIPGLLAHLVVLAVLFLVYANHLGVRIF